MIGIDLVKTARIKGMIERHGDRALSRFLGRDEIALIKRPDQRDDRTARRQGAFALPGP